MMLKKLESRICPDGLVTYSDDIIDLMKINKKHFHSNKPEGFKLLFIVRTNTIRVAYGYCCMFDK